MWPGFRRGRYGRGCGRNYSRHRSGCLGRIRGNNTIDRRRRCRCYTRLHSATIRGGWKVMILGVVANPYALNVPNRLTAEADRLGIQTRLIDLPSMVVSFQSSGEASVKDTRGVIEAPPIAPCLLFGFPAAIHAIKVLSWSARTQNPIDGVLLSDDKAGTAERLAHYCITQVATRVLSFDPDLALTTAEEIGYPVVLKRTHGAQGRWVRRAADPAAFEKAFRELAAQGPGAHVLDPEIGG